jgi:ParB-like chromosome segregation protein Spo0J
VAKPLTSHPVAALFPDLNAADFAALKEDIRKYGVKVPILVHGGQILDGRQRYRACQELGIKCRCTEWNGHDPWLEAQSRNLLRRQLSKEQVYAIRILAAQQFPEIAAPFEAERANAKARRAQAKGRPRGEKAALIGSRDRHRESADAIGAQVGVSGSTVKRVDRLARVAPELLTRVAAGELSVKRALREIPARDETTSESPEPAAPPTRFTVDRATERLEQVVRQEYLKCPREHRVDFLRNLQRRLQTLIREELSVGSHGVRSGPFDARDRDTHDMAEVRVGDSLGSGSHALLAGSFTPHGS